MAIQNIMFGVFSKSKSIGSNNSDPIKTFADKEEAKLYAKSMRKHLTVGERKYYKMGYVTRQLSN